ncbi:MAG: ChaN family lipoprotein [Bacteroidetes bacterium]|nr:ChaN family lipoprotein [Bacteroidota bacterium]
MKRLLLFSSCLLLLSSFMGDNPAYRLFRKDGKLSSYQNLLKEAQKADIVLFGELHNNPIAHWMQLELTQDLYMARGKDLILGAEMLEADNQLILSEYIAGMIRKKDFESGMANLWNNYKTDYAPLVDFAASKKIPFIATNIPRRYAAMVNQKGFEALDSINARARGMIAPLPIPYDPSLPGYQKMLSMGQGQGMHGTNNLPKAQAIKDATMAHFIMKNGSEGKLFLHFHGSYHSDNFEGIVWYLKKYGEMYSQPLNILTIATVTQQEIEKLEESNVNLANFILCVPETMTGTY